MNLEIHYLITSLNLTEGGSSDGFIWILPLKKSLVRVLSNSTNNTLLNLCYNFTFSTSPLCKDVDFVLLVEDVYGIP